MFQSSKGSSSLDSPENEYIDHDKLYEFVFDDDESFPEMKSFSDAVCANFYNGPAKTYCRELSILCANISLSTESRDTFSDRFKLMRSEVKPRSRFSSPHTRSRSQSRRHSRSELMSPMFDTIENDNFSAPCSSRSTNSSVCGRQICDLMVLNKKNNPIVIFECKSQASESTQGMAQLVSHGLALRHKKQITHKIKLILLTPVTFYSASLPPYKEEPENNLDVTFESFDVLFERYEKYVLCRKEYLAFLENIRHHFVSVKSVL